MRNKNLYPNSEYTHARDSSTMLGSLVWSMEVNNMAKKVRALGQEWELVNVVGQTATIKNETGSFSILKDALEEVKPEKKADKEEKKPAKKSKK